MLRILLVAAGAAACAVAWKTTSAAHDPEHVRNVTCFLITLPFAAAALIAELVVKARAKAKAAPAQRRPGYGSFGQSGTRRRL